MYFRAEIIKMPCAILSVQEHAGKGGNSDLTVALTRKQHRIDIHDRARSWRNHKLIGTCNRRAVKKRENRHACIFFGRLYEPEFTECRKLLSSRKGGVDGQATCRQAIELILCQ